MGQLVHLHHEEKSPYRYVSWPGCIFIEWKDIKADTFCGQNASSLRGETSKQIHFVAREHLHRVERHQSRCILWPGCIFIEWKDIKEDTFRCQDASSLQGKEPMRIHFTVKVHLHHEEKSPCGYISPPGCIFIEWKGIKEDTFCCQGASSSRGKVQKQICSTANYKKKSSIGHSFAP